MAISRLLEPLTRKAFLKGMAVAIFALPVFYAALVAIFSLFELSDDPVVALKLIWATFFWGSAISATGCIVIGVPTYLFLEALRNQKGDTPPFIVYLMAGIIAPFIIITVIHVLCMPFMDMGKFSEAMSFAAILAVPSAIASILFRNYAFKESSKKESSPD